ncbi:sulfite exporter TauE/SafE family protein [Vibrio sp. JC009]|uniref:sulfite exporter TauE/SafE family protein n=1 Tax=Vibrio sp. JC009 TaxID=2912314 RepID=UPI0023B127A0|nr:sulfite exporter TauE/SafE family protein [Vibrio sp. JC009]WED24922.1 sulfite exporter TauE/SafE family protein [Vibrio sp. JC009]
MITDLFFYLTAIPAVLVYGIGKGGFGGALGVIAVPLMALTTPPFQAASILLPILCVMDFFAVRYHVRHCDFAEIKLMLPSALLGILVGSAIMGMVSDRFVELFIGGISLLFCLQYYLKGNSKQTSKFAGYFWSLISGISSTMIHAGGGPISIYLLPKKLDKRVMVGTMAVFFAIMNFIKLIPYTYFGQFDSQNLLTSLVLIPLAPVGVKLGVYLLQVISQEQVYKICYFLLLLSGGKLFYSGLLG